MAISGDELRARREQLGISAQRFSELAGVTTRSLRNWEDGKPFAPENNIKARHILRAHELVAAAEEEGGFDPLEVAGLTLNQVAMIVTVMEAKLHELEEEASEAARAARVASRRAAAARAKVDDAANQMATLAEAPIEPAQLEYALGRARIARRTAGGESIGAAVRPLDAIVTKYPPLDVAARAGVPDTRAAEAQDAAGEVTDIDGPEAGA